MIWIQPRCSFEDGDERCAQEPRHEIQIHVELGSHRLVVDAKLCDEHREWFYAQPNVERIATAEEAAG